jgi:hypothetical protein
VGARKRDFSFTKWDIFFVTLDLLSDLFSACRDQAVRAQERPILHSNKSGKFSLRTRGVVTDGTLLNVMI